MGLLGSMVAGAAIAHGTQRNQEVSETRAAERAIFAQQANNAYDERMAERKAAAGVAAGDRSHSQAMERDKINNEFTAGRDATSQESALAVAQERAVAPIMNAETARRAQEAGDAPGATGSTSNSSNSVALKRIMAANNARVKLLQPELDKLLNDAKYNKHIGDNEKIRENMTRITAITEELRLAKEAGARALAQMNGQLPGQQGSQPTSGGQQNSNVNFNVFTNGQGN